MTLSKAKCEVVGTTSRVELSILGIHKFLISSFLISNHSNKRKLVNLDSVEVSTWKRYGVVNHYTVV
ncbi:hypothetical protein MHC_04415 [Mycoplasma haemocanis str. Illinois]|uniref:Uncharacterized protein n=1 Tax=Mycoplasma haemocanis (strain Illinois) TaxID=1111676 RepID=H6N7W7_MYCHN|nr:hypothetical protein [Mycoplasma haemocanis]AEW45739.1 hypothetical protein MHC_04415 [Mycoplasma haemocanis str. Illinois]